jgi:hypothetical protein
MCPYRTGASSTRPALNAATAARGAIRTKISVVVPRLATISRRDPRTSRNGPGASRGAARTEVSRQRSSREIPARRSCASTAFVQRPQRRSSVHSPGAGFPSTTRSGVASRARPTACSSRVWRRVGSSGHGSDGSATRIVPA